MTELDALREANTQMAHRDAVYRVALQNAHIEHCRTACPVKGREIDDRCTCGLSAALKQVGTDIEATPWR